MRWPIVIFLILSLPVLANRGVVVTFKQSEAPDAPVAGQMQLYSKSYALVIGIDDYTGDWSRLSEAVNDATKVAAVLEQKGFDVTLRTNLSSRDLKTTFEDFFIDKGDDPESRLFVWFAGHGHTVKGEGYLIAADGVLETDVKNFKRKSLSLRRFSELVRLAESKHVYTVFDSCFAGTIFNVARSAAPPAITRVTAQPVRQFLTSGDAGQLVSDDGTFANLFIEALRGERKADLNLDGFLTAEELGVFLTNEISNYTENAQVPRHGKLRDPKFNRGDFVFLSPLGGQSISTLSTIPAMPGDTEGFSLDDIRARNAEENEVKAAWARQLAAMNTAAEQTWKLATGGDVGIEARISALDRFISTFAEDNPYSKQDNTLRHQMMAYRQRIVAYVKPDYLLAAVNTGKRVIPSMQEKVYKVLMEVQALINSGTGEKINAAAQDKAFHLLWDVLDGGDLSGYEIAQVWNLAAFIYYGSGDIPNTIDAYAEVLRQGKLSVTFEATILRSLAKLYFLQTEYDASLAHIEREEQLAPSESVSKFKQQIQLAMTGVLTTKVPPSISLSSFALSDGDYLPIVKVQPQYPRSALSRGQTGWVIVEFTVSKSGTITDPHVIKNCAWIQAGGDGDKCQNSPSSLFDRSAIQAALKFKYKPKVVNGEAVATSGVQNRIVFDLTEG